MIADLEGLKGLGVSALLLAALLFGFAPGVLLRIVVLILPKEDPRRRELIAELYTIPRWDRLNWVGQQLEVCLFEGIGARRGPQQEQIQPLATPLGSNLIVPDELITKVTDDRGRERSVLVWSFDDLDPTAETITFPAADLIICHHGEIPSDAKDPGVLAEQLRENERNRHRWLELLEPLTREGPRP